MNDKPDTISVNASAETELQASSADVDLQLDGSSVFAGDEAFKKAKELKELSETLTAAGLEANQITIQGIRLSSEGLLAWKSSSCRYSVRIRKAPCDLLSKILGSIAAQKGVSMTGLIWRFDTLDAELIALRQRAMAELLATARQSASLLGVDLLGVHSLEETVLPPESEKRFGANHSVKAGVTMSRALAPPTDLGLTMASRAMAKLSVTATFRVSPFRTQEHENE